MRLTRCHLSAAITTAIFTAAIALAPEAKAACDNCGTVVETKTVKKEGEGSGAGAVVGGVLGGVLGHQIGSGRGNTAATVAGALGGALVGNEVEKRQKTTAYWEVRVRLEDGSSKVVRFDTAPSWRAGDKVRVENGRIVPR